MAKHVGSMWASVSCAFMFASFAAASPSVQEACGQIIVVSYRGALGAADAITRSKSDAHARAETLLKNAQHGDFAAIAKASSDAPSSAARGGVMGTFAKSEWPELHAAIEAPLFRLTENQIASKLVEAAYGYVIVKRCKVEKAHARHLLIRYAGAKNAKPEITRSREQAEHLAQSVLAGIHDDQQFAEAIAKYSEDGSRDRGGDIGSVGRGRLALTFEDALFALKVGERSGVVESEFGFHIIERMPDVP
jgi:parvulin-like peptidyl-prolyl isomerase